MNYGNNADLVFISVPSSSVPSSARLAGVTTVTTTTSMRRNSHYIENYDMVHKIAGMDTKADTTLEQHVQWRLGLQLPSDT